MSESQGEAKPTPPESLDAAYVFEQVRTMLASDESRNLWRKVESEMRGGEIDASYTYLRARFTSLKGRVCEDLDHFNDGLR